MKEYPVVLGFQEVHPDQLSGVKMHADRAGGDLSHCDPSRRHLTKVLIGGKDWVQKLRKEIAAAKMSNFREEIAALERRKDKKTLAARLEEGPKEPWKPGRKKQPLREFLVSADHRFFLDQGFKDLGIWNDELIEKMDKIVLDLCKSGVFGKVYHLRRDMDETGPHWSGIGVAWVEKESTSRGKQKLIQPSSVVWFNNYEKAHDEAAKAFEAVGLVRGKRWAQEAREAIERGEVPVPGPKWVHPSEFWKEKQREALKERKEAERLRAEAEDTYQAAQSTLDYVAKKERRLQIREAQVAEVEALTIERENRVEQREEAADIREVKLDAREAELDRKAAWVVEGVKQLVAVGEKIRAAAQAVGLLEAPVVQAGLEAWGRMREWAMGWERTR